MQLLKFYFHAIILIRFMANQLSYLPQLSKNSFIFLLGLSVFSSLSHFYSNRAIYYSLFGN